MITVRRLVLVLLLALLIVSFSGHLLNTASRSYHAFPESTCALHMGIIAPEFLSAHTHQSNFESVLIHDNTLALCLGANIHHPPTM